MTNCYFPNTKSLIDYIGFEPVFSERNLLKKIQKTALNSLYFVTALFPLLCSLSLDCFQLVGRILHKPGPPAPEQAPEPPPPAILQPLPDLEEPQDIGMIVPEIEEPAPNADSFLQRHWKKTALTTAIFLSASIYFTYLRFYE